MNTNDGHRFLFGARKFTPPTPTKEFQSSANNWFHCFEIVILIVHPTMLLVKVCFVLLFSFLMLASDCVVAELSMPVAHKEDYNVLVVVPGFGYHGDRYSYLMQSLKVLKTNSSVPTTCMLFIYVDSTSASKSKQNKLSEYCTVLPYYYGNYADFIKAVPYNLVILSGFSHVLLLLDDVVLHENYNLNKMIHVMNRNNLTVASPAVHAAKYWTTRKHKFDHDLYDIGHVTNTLEIFAALFTIEGWKCWYDMMDPTINAAGWGYDEYIQSYCSRTIPGFKIGVLDCMEATHRDKHWKVRRDFVPKHASSLNAGEQKLHWLKVLKDRRNETYELGSTNYFFDSLKA